MSSLELLASMRESEVAADSEAAAGNRAIAAFLAKQPKQPADMIRVFDRGSYYTVHGRDAHTVAAEYFKSSAAVKYTAGSSADDRQPYLTFNKTMGSEVLRAALLEQRRRIEVYASTGSSWSLARKGSPGNLQAFEEECLSRDADLSTDTSPVIVAVRLARGGGGGGGGGSRGGARLVGCAFIDCQVRSIRVSEFEDDEHLSTLESLLCQQGARECLVPAELVDAERSAMRDVLELCEVPLTTGKKGSFQAKDAAGELRKLLGAPELHNRRLFESRDGLALSAASGLVGYLDLLASSNHATHGLWTLDWVDASQFMRLDAGAMRALSVEPLPQDKDKNASLLGLLSVCKTAMGLRLVRKWLKQPLLSRADLEERYDVVDAFVRGYETRSLLRDEVLPRLGADLDKLGRAFAARKAGLREVVHTYYFVLGLPKLLQALRAHDACAASEEEAALLRRKFTAPLEGVYTNFTNLVRLVQAAVDLAAAHRHEWALLPHFSEALQDLSDQRDEVRERIEAHHKGLCKATGFEADRLRLEVDPRFGYCLRVSRKDETDLRKVTKVKFDQLMTKKEGVFVRDSHLSSYAEEYAQVSRKYDAEQRALAAKVVETAATFGPVIAECHALLAELDVLLGFAHVASSAPEPYVRPTLVLPEDARQRIVLRGCRHPCVERIDAASGGGASYIKNDIELVRGASSLQVVTGPNMGGKSTYIRSAGVSVLLAQIGCFVPCDEAEISLVDCILARVGAGDCQSRGVSTFMAEMLETATILKGASPASLVIIDELGRGTSTYDGFGLAWAIAEHLVSSVGCCTLFATHFHELTELAISRPQVVNRHVSAHLEDGAMTMLYRVEDGPCDKAFGIHVAEVAQFPADVVAGAKRKLAELEAADYSGDADADGGAATTAARARARPALSDRARRGRRRGERLPRRLPRAARRHPAEEEAHAVTRLAGDALGTSASPLSSRSCARPLPVA